MASNKLRAAMADDGDELAIDMSPMIDMVFLLLIFFLVNATMIIVKQDANVKPPVASYSKKASDGTGRIVINIYENGDFFSENGDPLTDEAAIEELVKKEKEKIDLMGYQPKLHLRGDKEAVFKYCRQVIRASARGGVDQVLFSTYGFEAR
ncbi:biopolymer transport protein ExbD [Haloferula luteola]|uniref:Biopolymer transport protein ExbD n=1 Tax=Haloferula luteola TaxID=595692 RepID=A0A840VG22_9BACT|nr:biopolymer transporter ExbD [Haloferula luteola]MBB5353548.1 biopolymer transport protein ExbD [Haloferula luteola]